MPTNSAEQSHALGGDFSSYYNSRGARGDWYGSRGFSTSNGLDFLGKAAMGRLYSAYMANATAGRMDVPYPTASDVEIIRSADAGWPAFRRDVSQRLAIAHMNAIDGDTLGVPHNLNMQQVIDYHERVFADVGLPPGVFGGNALGRNPIGQWAMGLSWYSGCE